MQSLAIGEQIYWFSQTGVAHVDGNSINLQLPDLSVIDKIKITAANLQISLTIF